MIPIALHTLCFLYVALILHFSNKLHLPVTQVIIFPSKTHLNILTWVKNKVKKKIKINK